MNNQQNERVILWLTWRKYETIYQLLTCTCVQIFSFAHDFSCQITMGNIRIKYFDDFFLHKFYLDEYIAIIISGET